MRRGTTRRTIFMRWFLEVISFGRRDRPCGGVCFSVLSVAMKFGRFYLCAFRIHFSARLVAIVAGDLRTNSGGTKVTYLHFL